MGAVRHSPTALQQFLDVCERQFYYKRVLKLPEPSSEYLEKGNIYHDALATVLGKKICPPLQAIPNLEANIERLKEKVFPWLDPEAIEEWAKKYYCGKIDLISKVTPVTNELNEIVSNRPGRCVVDWKIVFKKPKWSQKKADESIQLALYAIETGAHSAAYVEIPDNPVWPIRTFVTHYPDYYLKRWKRWLDAQFAAMDSRGTDEAAYRLASVNHGLCSPRWCPYWKRCPGGEG